MVQSKEKPNVIQADKLFHEAAKATGKKQRMLLEKARFLDPMNADVKVGFLYLENPSPKERLQALTKLYNEELDRYRKAGLIKDGKGDLEDTIHNRCFLRILVRIGGEHVQEGDFLAAQKVFTQVLAYSPKDAMGYHYILSKIDARLNDRSAFEALWEAYDDDPVAKKADEAQIAINYGSFKEAYDILHEKKLLEANPYFFYCKALGLENFFLGAGDKDLEDDDELSAYLANQNDNGGLEIPERENAFIRYGIERFLSQYPLSEAENSLLTIYFLGSETLKDGLNNTSDFMRLVRLYRKEPPKEDDLLFVAMLKGYVQTFSDSQIGKAFETLIKMGLLSEADGTLDLSDDGVGLVATTMNLLEKNEEEEEDVPDTTEE